MAIDPESGKILETIQAGRRPRGIAVSPDGKLLFVAVSGSPIGGPDVDDDKLPPSDHKADGIAVVDLASGKVSRVLDAGSDPETFAVSDDGRTIFVSNEDEGAVSAISVDGSRAKLTAKVGEEPEGVAVSHEGARLFVACEASDHVAMLDARTLKPIRNIALAGRPRSLLMSADGRTLFVSVESAGQVALLSAADGSVVRMVDVAKGDGNIKPMGMVQGPDGHLFATTGRGGSLVEIDPEAGTVLRTVANVGERPWGLAISKDARRLFTANGPSNDIAVIDRSSGTIVRKIAAGTSPWGVAAR